RSLVAEASAVALTINPGPQRKTVPDRPRWVAVASGALRRVQLRQRHCIRGEMNFLKREGLGHGVETHHLHVVIAALRWFTVERDDKMGVRRKEDDARVGTRGVLNAATLKDEHVVVAHRRRQMLDE